MPCEPTAALLSHAARTRSAIGAFNIVHLETAEGLARAAEAADAPLILQISENCVAFHGGLEPLARATAAIAARSSAPLALHLDHAEDVELALEAVDLGFGSVMYDGAKLPYAENVANTRRVVDYAHAAGAIVEAELGEIGGKDGAHAPGVRTDPDEAERFVDETGVDALAVAVGSSHAMTDRSATLDFALITRLRDAVPVPLVLHGSSGVSDRDLQIAVASGIAKVNVSTHLTNVFTRRVRETLASDVRLVDSRKYIAPARDAMSVEAARLLRVLSGAPLD
ncbi:class II fructose-bisphosphate aldolase [Microbacterium sp. RURRCA19A]|uniref:class II fructose-bisphosphate aldolase n=1 Tax=Microbacterium sp. RURRCA19A TaxID=1907391 RepID=UPI000953E310|nr:class II fructose-bisphosphate aldolase [Microbacterium sp. RURRCA19A]SIR96826.1 fructose-bisphosphate aldolase, class II [Microbacterium sp. RURRCA19A]